MKLAVQYLNDKNGKLTAVQIPAAEWEKLTKKYQRLERLLQLKTDLEQAFEEVEQIKSGKLPKQTLTDFLNEV